MGYTTHLTSRSLKSLARCSSARSAWITLAGRCLQFEEPIILETLGSVASRCAEIGRHFLHIPTDVGRELDTYRELIADGVVEGFIVANRVTEGDRRVDLLLEEKVPFVAYYGATPLDGDYPSGRCRLRRGLCAGHQAPARPRPPACRPSQLAAQLRRPAPSASAGYRAAMAERNVWTSGNWVVGGPKTEEFGYSAMRADARQRRLRPPASSALSTMAAQGRARRPSTRAGVVVGQDISLVNFDDNVARQLLLGAAHRTVLTGPPARSHGGRFPRPHAIAGEAPQTLHHLTHPELIIRELDRSRYPAELAAASSTKRGRDLLSLESDHLMPTDNQAVPPRHCRHHPRPYQHPAALDLQGHAAGRHPGEQGGFPSSPTASCTAMTRLCCSPISRPCSTR